MAEQVVLKIQTCTVRHDAPGPEAKPLLDAKQLQVQLTCGDINIETPWKKSGSSFYFEKELALPDNELEFFIFGRGDTQDNVGVPVARALEERDGKLTECDKDTPDKMERHGGRKGLKHIELKLVPLDATTPVLGTLVIFLNAPKGSQPPPTASATAPTPATTSSGGGGGSAGGGGPLLQAAPEAGPQTGAGAGAGAGGASGGSGGAGMEGWEAAAQAADEAADEAQHEKSLPELSGLFAKLHKLRSDLKKEQRVKEHREQECAVAEKALDDAREQVKEQAALLEECETRRQHAVPEDRRRERMSLLEEKQLKVRAELEETHAALGRAQSELEEVRERGKKVIAHIIAQQEGLITRPWYPF